MSDLALRYKSLIVLAVVVLAQLLLMAWQLRRQQDVPLVRNTVVYVVAPVQRALAASTRAVRGVWDGYIGLRGTRQENQTLTRELGELKMENQRLKEQAEQARRLQALFDLREKVPLMAVGAQIISTGSSDTSKLLMIDKGAEAGIRVDMPVLVPDGAVGKVLHVFPRTAQVLLITDPYSGAAVLLEGSRSHGILKGDENRPLRLEYVPNGDEIKTGQLVLTSGEDRIFPKGIPAGVVVEAKPGPEFQLITVQPTVALNRLEEVLVLLQSGGEIVDFPTTTRAAPEPPANQQQEAAAPTVAVPARPLVSGGDSAVQTPAGGPEASRAAPAPQLPPRPPVTSTTPAPPDPRPAPAVESPVAETAPSPGLSAEPSAEPPIPPPASAPPAQ